MALRVCEWRQARTQTISLVLAWKCIDAAHCVHGQLTQSEKKKPHAEQSGGCVCGEPLIFYIIVKAITQNTCRPYIHARRAARERARTITRAKKRTHAFVLQALTSNIRRDNKCSAALCAAWSPSLDLCSTAGWPVAALANRRARTTRGDDLGTCFKMLLKFVNRHSHLACSFCDYENAALETLMLGVTRIIWRFFKY